MDETTDKELEVMKGANRKSLEIGRISVTGYDNDSPEEDVVRKLKKLYSSCGEITDVYIPRDRYNALWVHAYIYFVGEGAVNKALQLNGSDIGGGRTVFAKTCEPFPKESVMVAVEGYDTSLSKSDIECELIKLFSLCGEILQVSIFKGTSRVFMNGEEAEEKALKLSGSYIGGHKVIVRFVTRRGKTTVHPRRRKGSIICGRPDK